MEVGGQPPLDFDAGAERYHLLARIEGINVYGKPDGPASTLAHLLERRGIDATVTRGEIRIPIKHLGRAVGASDLLDIAGESPLDTLIEAFSDPPPDGIPIIVTVDDEHTLNLSWPGEGFERNEPFPLSKAAALVAAGLNITAHPDAWDKLSVTTQIPIPIASARLSRSRYVEISSPSPQRIVDQGVEILFRTKEGKYGTPLEHATKILNNRNIIWSGPRPSEATEKPDPGRVKLKLSRHTKEDLRALARSVSSGSGQAVAWESGLGRRLFALAAVEMLDGWPCTVVCHQPQIWTWYRLAGMLGRSVAFTHARSDIRIVTYTGRLADHTGSPASVILDEVDTIVDEGSHEALKAARSYDSILDPYRIALARSRPRDAERLKTMMSLVRPDEFCPDMPVSYLYVSEAEKMLERHAALYLSERTLRDTERAGFPSSGTITVDPNPTIRKTLEDVLSETREPVAKAAEALALVSRGTGTTLSPKISLAAQKAEEATRAGRSVAVVANSRETLDLVKQFLPLEVAESTLLEMVLAGRSEPKDLRRHASIVFVDYPQSYTYAESMVGRPGAPGSPRTIDILHMRGSTDDRIAEVLALREESSEIADPNQPYRDRELEILTEPTRDQ